jgi:hypothetical protein
MEYAPFVLKISKISSINEEHFPEAMIYFFNIFSSFRYQLERMLQKESPSNIRVLKIQQYRITNDYQHFRTF